MFLANHFTAACGWSPGHMDAHESLMIYVEGGLMRMGNPVGGLVFTVGNGEILSMLDEVFEVDTGSGVLTPCFQRIDAKTFRLNGNCFTPPLKGKLALYQFCLHNLFVIKFLGEPVPPIFLCRIEYLKDKVQGTASPVFESMIFQDSIRDPAMGELLLSRIGDTVTQCGCPGLHFEAPALQNAAGASGDTGEDEESSGDIPVDEDEDFDTPTFPCMSSHYRPKQVCVEGAPYAFLRGTCLFVQMHTACVHLRS